MNSFISWIGGKNALRPVIYQRIPKNIGRYIEVFGGGGWVLFGRPPDTCMEVYNDFNSNLVNLFRCVKERPFALLKELNFLPLNSRDDFNVLKKYLEKEEFTSQYLQEELELAQHYLSEPQFGEIKPILLENAQMCDVKKAAAFFKVIRYSYGSGCTSFGCQPFDIRKTFDLIWSASRRLKNTVIENKDFEPLIRQYDREDALTYCDPPYFESEGHYAVVFRMDDHLRLRNVLGDCHGKFIVSYNDCPQARELYKGFYIESVRRPNNLAQRYNKGCEYAEILISNYDTSVYRAKPVQMGLFDLSGSL